jgi:hypothetical protein
MYVVLLAHTFGYGIQIEREKLIQTEFIGSGRRRAHEYIIFNETRKMLRID